MGWRDYFIFILIIQTGNTSEIGQVFLMYGLALFLLRNFCSVVGLYRWLCFYVFLNACRSNQLLAGMGWRADYHYS